MNLSSQLYRLRHNLSQNKPLMLAAFALLLIAGGVGVYGISRITGIGPASRAADTVRTVTYTVKTATDGSNQVGSTLETPSAQRPEGWIGSASAEEISYLGARFSGSVIPANAVITKAEFVLRSSRNQDAAIDVAVSAEQTEAPAPFTEQKKPSQRALTAASTQFKPTTAWVQDQVYTIDVTSSIQEVVADYPSRALSSFAIVVRSNDQSEKRRYISNGSLRITYRARVTTTPTSTPTATPSSATPTPHPEGGATHDSTQTGNNAKAYGIWTPNTKFDKCYNGDPAADAAVNADATARIKEIHDAFKVTGPDGKIYPTWHAPFVTDSKTGATCYFGHDHGRDPKDFKGLAAVKKFYAYDANKNGTIESSEQANAGLPFGYVNEQLDVYNAANNTPNLMRHENHVGHKVEWGNDVSVDINTNNTSGTRRPTGVKCNFLSKFHQGTQSKDAFSNNLHEVMTYASCDNNNYELILQRLLAFGAPGEFSTDPLCEPRGRIVVVGFANTNPNYPGVRGRGAREIPVRECVEKNFLVTTGFSGSPYEIWQGLNTFRSKEGKVLTRGTSQAFAVFDTTRYYYPGHDTTPGDGNIDDVGYFMEACYETGPNGGKVHGGPCDATFTRKDVKRNEIVSWDDPRSAFRGLKRETYFQATEIANGAINNPGKISTYYSDPFGNNLQGTPFTGALKQYIVPKDIDYGRQFGGNLDPTAMGADRPYGTYNGKDARVHAPN